MSWQRNKTNSPWLTQELAGSCECNLKTHSRELWTELRPTGAHIAPDVDWKPALSSERPSSDSSVRYWRNLAWIPMKNTQSSTSLSPGTEKTEPLWRLWGSRSHLTLTFEVQSLKPKRRQVPLSPSVLAALMESLRRSLTWGRLASMKGWMRVR